MSENVTHSERETAREQITEIGISMLEEGLTQRTSGNVSRRIDDGEIAISPSGVPYHEIDPQDVPIITLNGEVRDGDRAPSSESPMHTAVYRERDDVEAIIHTHSPYATTFAALGRPLEPSHYLIAFAGKRVDVAEYGTNGTQELAENALESLGDRNAVLLRNHGVLATGPDLETAYNVASRVEYCARIHFQASMLGEPELVDDAELDDLIDYFQDYA